MSESDTMFNERDRRCAAVQLMLSTDPSYDSQNHRWIATNNRDVPREMKTISGYGYGLWCGFKWGPHHATSHLRSWFESQHQSVPGDSEECGDPLVQSGGRWHTLGAAPAHKSKGTQAWLQKECYPSLTGPPPPPTWTHWTNSFGHTSRTLTWPPTTPKPAWLLPSAEYSPSSPRRLWKRHALSSGSVSRRWLRLKAATLNRCQLNYIIKLPELIISIKVLK